jgi:hypothetical protein
MDALQASYLRQSHILNVVEGEQQPVLRGNGSQCARHGSPETWQESRTVGIDRIYYTHPARRPRGHIVDRISTPIGAKVIHMTLRQDGAKPGGELAASMEVDE